MPKERILIADDEPDVLALCVRIIRSEGYEVTGVTNGVEAIRAAEKQQFDLFLTDIMMPGIKGLEAAQAIREFQPNIVCMVMTGFGTMDTAIEALKLGFTEFVVKPFKPHELKAAVNRALEKERLRTELERLHALVPLFELNKTFMSTVEEDELARQVLRVAATQLRADLGILMLRDRQDNLQIHGAHGRGADAISPELKQVVLRAGSTLVQARRQVSLPASQDVDPAITAAADALSAQSMLLNPLLAVEAPVGALLLARTSGAPFSSVDRELMSVLCGQAAIALQNARLFQEIQRAYRELQELDHMKSEFINIAAHELRTPLAILMGHADLLQEDVDDPKVKERLQIIVRNALRLRDLINDLLEMRYLQTAEARVHPTEFYVQDLVSLALQDFRPIAERKGIAISARIAPTPLRVCVDRQKILVAFNNLVKNALEFTPSGGRIGIDVTQHDREVHVAVWDTGVGIPEDQLEKIFEPFYQVEDSLTREHEGMGLGLSIAKGMIELCGGRIWVESVLGKGSRFTFSIPLRG